MTPQQQSAWGRFLSDTNRPADTPCYECFHFCNTEKAANALLALVLTGQKTATTSCKACYDAAGEPLPFVGSLSLVTDFAGTPACVIETAAVTVMPFCDMTYEICKREGEDRTLDTWQDNHRRFFALECADLGLVFEEKMDVVFEDFTVIHRF